MTRTLRDYQLEALDLTRRHFDTHDSGIIVGATGTGKTVLFARIASEWPGNVLVLAHRRELIYQSRDKIAAETGREPIVEMNVEGACEDDVLPSFGNNIVVASVQTMYRPNRLEKYRRAPFDLITIDEVHHAVAQSYCKIVDFFRTLNPKMKVLGVTATPRRADKKALGLRFEASDSDKYGGAIHRMDILEAVRAGWLCDIRQEFIELPELKLDDLQLKYNENGERDFDPGKLEQVLMEEGPVLKMVRALLDKCVGPTLVFTAGVAHAHLLKKILHRHVPGCAAAVDGTTPKPERDGINKALGEGELRYLCSFGTHTEGFDCPAVKNIFMGRPTKSQSLYLQMLGRGGRPLDHLAGTLGTLATPEERRALLASSDKPWFNVFDVVGNSRHSAICALDCLGGTVSTEAVRRLKKKLATGGGTVVDELNKVEARIDDENEERRRKPVIVKPTVKYTATPVDPFRGHDVAPKPVAKTRGSITDKQLDFLVGLGVDYHTAASYSKGQAGVVIDKLTAKRCTNRQRACLEKHGFCPDVPYATAKEIINRIAASGWTLRGSYQGVAV